MLAALALLAGPVVAQAALELTDGGLGVYDTTNNITWTSNANLFGTQYASSNGSVVGTIISDWSSHTFTDGHTLSLGDFVSSGRLTWWGAEAWVNYLDVTNYGGSNQWALPTVVDTSSNAGCGASCAYPPSLSSGQMVQLFYGGMGQSENAAITSVNNGAAGYNLFSNVQNESYWSGTGYSADSTAVWTYFTGNGYQGIGYKDGGNGDYALAVSLGQVPAVPEPGAAWLLGIGVLGLVGLGRRKAQTSVPR